MADVSVIAFHAFGFEVGDSNNRRSGKPMPSPPPHKEPALFSDVGLDMLRQSPKILIHVAGSRVRVPVMTIDP
jgi:hypothetical protein